MRVMSLRPLRSIGTVAALLLIAASSVGAQDEPPPNAPHDFAISRAWLEALVAQKTFLPTFRVEMEHRPTAGVNGLAKDCEMHMAARLVDESFGEPPFLVVEPPNLCRFKPNNATPTTTTPNLIWKNLFDTSMKDKECDVTGFPRSVHRTHGRGRQYFTIESGARPGDSSGHAHHLRWREASRFHQALQDVSRLDAHPAGFRPDVPLNAQDLVKYHGDEDQYEFFQRRSGKCGNLAIVEVTGLPREFIQQTGGGRTAIGRITANGEDTRTLKLYAIEGTPADEWFARVKDGKEQFDDPRLVQGFLTYDYFAIIRALEEKDGKLAQPKSWVEVRFPMAMVILGPTTKVPWEQ